MYNGIQQNMASNNADAIKYLAIFNESGKKVDNTQLLTKVQDTINSKLSRGTKSNTTSSKQLDISNPWLSSSDGIILGPFDESPLYIDTWLKQKVCFFHCHKKILICFWKF